jgi:hypothetical protein
MFAGHSMLCPYERKALHFENRAVDFLTKLGNPDKNVHSMLLGLQ